MDEVSTRKGVLKLTAVDECYASVKLLLKHIKEQDKRIRLLEIIVANREGENSLIRPSGNDY